MEEHLRLQALHALDVLDTDPEQAFDGLTRLAAQALNLPMAAITLIDADRLWTKSSAGMPRVVAARKDALCRETIAREGLYLVPDTAADPLHRDSALVTQDDGIRFYAGAPVTLADGAAVGAVCVLDTKPHHEFEEADFALLRGLAAAASHLLELRREVAQRRRMQAKLDERARLLDLAEQMARVGHWRLDFKTNEVFMSPMVRQIHGLPGDFDPMLHSALDFYHEDDRDRIAGLVERAQRTGEGYSFEARLRRTDGSLRDVSSTGRVEFEDERPVALIGIFRDITEEKETVAVLTAAREDAERYSREMHRLATTDTLTELPNRRATVAATEAALGEIAAAPLTLAIVDLDHFKTINDRFGHDGGDEVLKEFARRCAQALAGHGMIGRLGGEEFAILLQETDQAEAGRILAAVRRAVSCGPMRLSAGQAVHVTFSAGLAEARADDTWHSLFGRADRALYRAKADGRDRLAVAA